MISPNASKLLVHQYTMLLKVAIMTSRGYCIAQNFGNQKLCRICQFTTNLSVLSTYPGWFVVHIIINSQSSNVFSTKIFLGSNPIPKLCTIYMSLELLPFVHSWCPFSCLAPLWTLVAIYSLPTVFPVGCFYTPTCPITHCCTHQCSLRKVWAITLWWCKVVM